MTMALKHERTEGFSRGAPQHLASPLQVAERLLMAHLALSADMAPQRSRDRREGRKDEGGKS